MDEGGDKWREVCGGVEKWGGKRGRGREGERERRDRERERERKLNNGF